MRKVLSSLSASPKKNPPLEILLVTWNGRRVLPACLKSIRKHTPVSHRILVWNNGSRDGTGRWLDRQKDLIVFHSDRNLGISGGFNALLRRARSPIVIRLDDDTLVPRHWIRRLLEPMQDPSVAVVGCKFVTPRGELRATEFMPPFFPAPLGQDGIQWRYTREVEAVGGPCCAFRVNAVRSVNGYDKSLSDQHEDIDLCLRLRRKGYKVICVNRLAVINRALNRRRWSYVPKNRKIFWTRWSDFPGFPRKDSHEIDRRYLLAWRFYRQGRFRAVVSQLKPVIDSPMREYGVQFLMALAYRALGDLGQARKSIRGLVRANSFSALLAESLWAYDQGDLASARRSVRKGSSHFPEEPAFQFLRTRLDRGDKKNFSKTFKYLSNQPDKKAYTDQKLGAAGILL